MAIGNLASRALVAVVAVPVVLLTLHVDAPEPTWALIFVASLLGMRELFAMTLTDHGDRRASLVMGAIAVAAMYWIHPVALHLSADSRFAAPLLFAGPMVAVMLAVIPPAIYYLFRFGDMTTSATRSAYTMMGIIYVGLPATFLSLSKRDFGDAGADVVALILLIAWVGDTGAYFAGRFLGKRKMYPAVSPKKTWAGAFGGLAGSTAATIVMKLWFLEQLSWLDVFLIAIPANMLGQLGDLFESLLKRSVGVKDSGTLLPGHGGMLDRIDAVLFIAPYVYLYLILRDPVAAIF